MLLALCSELTISVSMNNYFTLNRHVRSTMKSKCINLIFIKLFITIKFSKGEISTVTTDNYQDYFRSKSGSVFLYVTRDNCEICDLLYYKFVIVSQIFNKHNQISFGVVRDSVLVEAFEIKSFPEIVYYAEGSASPQQYGGAITATEVSKFIAHILKLDVQKLTVKYTVGLTTANFHGLMNNDKLTRIVLLHLNDDLVELDDFDELAEVFENDVDIVFASVNIDKQPIIKSWFLADRYPAFYWYTKGTVDKKLRFVGDLKLDQMIGYVNNECGYFRLKDGSLNGKAGLIEALDDIIKEHAKDINNLNNLALVKVKLKKEIAKLSVDTDLELAEFYVHLIDEVEEDRTVDALYETRNRLYRKMFGAQPFQMDQITRMKNIVNKVLNIVVNSSAQTSRGRILDSEDANSTEENPDHDITFHTEF